MNQLNRDLRKEWELLPTPELEEMLRLELERKPPDDDAVLTLLHILEAREAETPMELTRQEQEVWNRYRSKRKQKSGRKPAAYRWLSLVASLLLVMTLLVTMVPQKAEAETFWEMLQRITNTVMEYFSGDGIRTEMGYAFATDNPGLQQVYEAVLELGVTDPMVPMWLPEGYVLTSIVPKNTPMSKGIWVDFSDGTSEAVFQVDVYLGEPAHRYYKDNAYYESYEWEGTTYQITRNNSRWAVIWEKDNTECYLTLECQEDTLRRILRSIYVMGAE